tara:strand:- start:603 stop:758 length:156 start_codon:yes stop_codon:yes gene_type:complete
MALEPSPSSPHALAMMPVLYPALDIDVFQNCLTLDVAEYTKRLLAVDNDGN